MDEQPAPRLARRRIAYAMAGGILGCAAGAFVVKLSEPQADVITAALYTMGLVVGAYMGAQVAPEVFRRRS